MIYHENIFPSGHNDVITKAVVSPSGKYVFTGGYDGKLKLWHLKTTKCIKDIKKYDYPIIGISISQDYIAVSTTSFVEILDLNTYEMKKRYNAYYGVFSPNGKYLLLLFHMKKAQLINAADGLFSLIGKLPRADRCTYTDGIPRFAVVLDNGSVALYRYQNNTFVHQKTVKMMDEYIGELKFSPKGDKLLTISYIGNILCIYNILSEKLITLDKVNSIHKSDAFAYLDTDTSGTPPNYDDTVVEVTTAPGKAVQTSRNYTFRGNGTFSYPDGDTVLASFQNADSIGYFDSATGKFKGINHAYYEPYRKNIMHKLYKKSQDFPWSIGMRQVNSIAYNRDGTYLFITRHGGRVEIWSTFTGKCLAILKAFNADAKKLAVSDDGDYIAFSTCGPNIKIYRMCDIHTTDSFDLCYSDNITDWKCKYNIRGEWRFQVRKSANKLYHFIYKTQEGHKQPIAGMEFSPDKKQLLTTAYDRSVKIWDLSDASRDQYNISPHCLYSIEFIPGLKVKGAVIQNLHSSSNLTDKELESLKTYGAIL